MAARLAVTRNEYPLSLALRVTRCGLRPQKACAYRFPPGLGRFDQEPTLEEREARRPSRLCIRLDWNGGGTRQIARLTNPVPRIPSSSCIRRNPSRVVAYRRAVFPGHSLRCLKRHFRPVSIIKIVFVGRIGCRYNDVWHAIAPIRFEWIRSLSGAVCGLENDASSDAVFKDRVCGLKLTGSLFCANWKPITLFGLSRKSRQLLSEAPFQTVHIDLKMNRFAITRQITKNSGRPPTAHSS